VHNPLNLIKEESQTGSKVRIVIIRCIVDVAITEINPEIRWSDKHTSGDGRMGNFSSAVSWSPS
jgi:hypothetical protein